MKLVGWHNQNGVKVSAAIGAVALFTMPQSVPAPSRESTPEDQALIHALAAMPSRQVQETSLDREPGRQTQEEGEAQDLELVAEAHGWTVEETRRDRRSAEAVGELAAQVAATYPDSFVGSAVDEKPDAPPRLYIKGKATDQIMELVSASDVPIAVIDGQPHNFAELDERKTRVARAALDGGYRNVVTSFDIANAGQIRLLVQVQGGLSSDPNEVRAMLPDDVRGQTVVQMSEFPVAQGEGAWGGMRVRSPNWGGDAFSVADLFEEALGVSVRTK